MEGNGEEVENNNGGYSGYEDERDLFGSDNEDYCKTPAASPYPIPGNLFWIVFFYGSVFCDFGSLSRFLSVTNSFVFPRSFHLLCFKI